jgi:hypothetical protein
MERVLITVLTFLVSHGRCHQKDATHWCTQLPFFVAFALGNRAQGLKHYPASQRMGDEEYLLVRLEFLNCPMQLSANYLGYWNPAGKRPDRYRSGSMIPGPIKPPECTKSLESGLPDMVPQLVKKLPVGVTCRQFIDVEAMHHDDDPRRHLESV